MTYHPGDSDIYISRHCFPYVHIHIIWQWFVYFWPHANSPCKCEISHQCLYLSVFYSFFYSFLSYIIWKTKRPGGRGGGGEMRKRWLCFLTNEPVKMNSAPHMHMTGVHLTINGTLTTASLSDIILTIQMVENRSFVKGFWQ